MATRSLLNLTLDEIIRTKKNEGRNQSFDSRNRNRGLNGRNQNWGFPKKSILSSSLSNRLSRGRGADYNNVKGDLRRHVIMQKRLGTSSELKRTPVHDRLTMNKNAQHFRAPLALQSRSLTKKRNLRSKSSDDFQPVRITNGAIVRGLRSDQLLLQKLNQHRNLNLKNKKEQLRQLKSGRIAARNGKRELRPNSSSKVSLNFNRGLTVSIANEVAKRAKASAKTRKYASPSPLSSSSSSEDVYPISRPTRRFSTEEAKDQALPSLLRLGLERPPPPKPHRQVLDPQIQKEISALQGFNEPHSVGPGPGVKGFRMLPSRTRHSLNERFTIERNVVE